MWPLIVLHLKQRKGLMIGWTIGVVAIVTMLMMVYPSIRDQAAQLNQALSQLPEALRSLKSNSDDLLSPAGYMNSQLFYATLPLLFGILAITLGSSLLARDEEDHTLELLLARPISRGRILAAKALAGLIIIGVVAAVATLDSIILGQIVGLEVSAPHLLLAMLFAVLLPVSFGALAFTVAATAGVRRAAVGAAILFGFGGYLLTSLAGLVDWLVTPAKLFPYHYYDSYGLLNGQLPGKLVLYLGAVMVSATVVSWLAFRQRDID